MPEMFKPEDLNKIEQKSEADYGPLEKLTGFRKQIWEKAKNLFGELNLSPRKDENWGKETAGRVKEIKQEEGEDNMFLDLDVEKDGENMELRTVAQIDKNYNPDREKNYDEWDLTKQEEAERWLNREVLVGEKLSKYLSGERVSADTLISGNRDAKSGKMHILKEVAKNTREIDKYGKAEGGALAKTLLDLRQKLKANEMIREITEEENIKTKLELEQKIFEDYFDHFDGYKENTEAILGDVKNKKFKKDIAGALENYRGVIEETQLGEDEYSLAHGNVKLENVVFDESGRALLKDWRRPGTTQNRELSLVYDLGDAMKGAVERFDDPKQAEDFVSGIEAEIRNYYQTQNPDAGEAVINLSKMRSFAEIVNDVEGKKKKFVEAQLKTAILLANSRK